MENNASTSLNKVDFVKATCRICYDEVSDQELIQPCKCTGSIGNVHKQCLDMWLERKFTPTCEICHSDYPTTVNYRWWKVWNHPWLAYILRKEAIYLYVSAIINIARTGIFFGTDVWIMVLLTAVLSGVLVSSLMIIVLIINLNRYVTWRLGYISSDSNEFIQNCVEVRNVLSECH